MSDTPRTDRCLTEVFDQDGFVDQRNCPIQWVTFSRQLERELNAANERINRLLKAGDTLANAMDDDEKLDAINKWNNS